MRRGEAEALVGETVEAWTAMNGTYVGVLEEVIPRRPWRARVRVTGVLKGPAFEWARGDRQRVGFREGDVIEVGGVNVGGTDKAGVPYAEAMRQELEHVRSLDFGGREHLKGRIVAMYEKLAAEG